METLINPASEREKVEGFEAVNGEEDRLSDLSDHVLHHIFSFINPKYSVQASVLGKRWRHFWRSLPNLNFQSDNPPHKSFVGILNQVLISPSNSERSVFDIQSFKLCYKDEAIACHVNTWVAAAVMHNVATVVIELPLEKGPVQLPSCLFNSKSLVDLDLGFGLNCPQLVLPSLIDLPKLKSLRLDNVALVDDGKVNSLISSCPSLVKLAMKLILEEGPVKLPSCLFNSRSLVDLDLVFGRDFPRFVLPSLIDLPKLKSLRLERVAVGNNDAVSSLILSCPSLVKLAMKLPLEKGPVQLPSSLFTCRSLVDLDLMFGLDFPQLVLPSLIDLPKLKSLKLNNIALIDDNVVRSLVSSCPFLESLMMVVGGDSLTKFVVNAPKLKSLIVSKYCKDGVLSDPSFNKPCRIMHATIDFRSSVPLKAMNLPEYRRKMVLQSVTHLAELLCNARSLVLSGWIVEAAFGLLRMMKKRFHNLEHLTLLYASSLSRDSALEIMHLMKISPNAKVLILETRKYDDGSQKAGTSDEEQFISANPEDCWDLGISKECLLQHLEVVRIEVAVGCPNEFKLLEFLLKNAVALDSVTITGNSPNEENGWISFKKKVMKIPRASSKVRIHFF